MVSWRDSRGTLSFGQCRAIIWRDTSQVQPASYLGTLAQELRLSKGVLPLAQVSHRRLPGHCLCVPVSLIHPCLLPSCLYLNRVKSLPAQDIHFEIYLPIKIDLKKPWEGQAGLGVSLLTMMGFGAEIERKQKTFWWCPNHAKFWTETKCLFLGWCPKDLVSQLPRWSPASYSQVKIQKKSSR